MYQQEMARSGKALFAIRGLYIYTIVAIGVLIAFLSGRLGPFANDRCNWAWFAASLAVALSGAIIRIVTSGYAALGTSGNTKKGAVAAELNTTGPYSLVRNPLYLGRILNFTGLAMLSGSWAYGAIVFLLAILVYERISVYEEEFLKQTFGEAHAKWAAEVPALTPRLHGWMKPKYQFWWRRALWRENKKLFTLATALILYDFARRAFSPSLLPADMTWYYAYAGVVAIELVFRALRHFTNYFSDLS